MGAFEALAVLSLIFVVLFWICYNQFKKIDRDLAEIHARHEPLPLKEGKVLHFRKDV